MGLHLTTKVNNMTNQNRYELLIQSMCHKWIAKPEQENFLTCIANDVRTVWPECPFGNYILKLHISICLGLIKGNRLPFIIRHNQQRKKSMAFGVPSDYVPLPPKEKPLPQIDVESLVSAINCNKDDKGYLIKRGRY